MFSLLFKENVQKGKKKKNKSISNVLLKFIKKIIVICHIRVFLKDNFIRRQGKELCADIIKPLGTSWGVVKACTLKRTELSSVHIVALFCSNIATAENE